MALQERKALLNLLYLPRANELDLPRVGWGSAGVECSHRSVQTRAELSQRGCAMRAAFEFDKGQSKCDFVWI